MKTNKVPEKIYLTTDGNNSFVFTQKRSDNKGIEYVRKDAFIEKAKEWLYLQLNEINMEGEDMENFLKDFKKHMEE